MAGGSPGDSAGGARSVDSSGSDGGGDALGVVMGASSLNHRPRKGNGSVHPGGKAETGRIVDTAQIFVNHGVGRHTIVAAYSDGQIVFLKQPMMWGITSLATCPGIRWRIPGWSDRNKQRRSWTRKRQFYLAGSHGESVSRTCLGQLAKGEPDRSQESRKPGPAAGVGEGSAETPSRDSPKSCSSMKCGFALGRFGRSGTGSAELGRQSYRSLPGPGGCTCREDSSRTTFPRAMMG